MTRIQERATAHALYMLGFAVEDKSSVEVAGI
jgi:hypothetical protein